MNLLLLALTASVALADPWLDPPELPPLPELVEAADDCPRAGLVPGSPVPAGLLRQERGQWVAACRGVAMGSGEAAWRSAMSERARLYLDAYAGAVPVFLAERATLQAQLRWAEERGDWYREQAAPRSVSWMERPAVAFAAGAFLAVGVGAVAVRAWEVAP